MLKDYFLGEKVLQKFYLDGESIKKIIILTVLLLSAIQISYSQVIQTAPGNYTWTCPAGVTSVTVECSGAGGGGGSTTSKSWALAGGGAGGSYIKYIATVTPGVTYNFTVGSGGTSGTSGGSSFFGNTATGVSAGSIVLATGGASGVSSTASGTSNTTFTTTLSGAGSTLGNLPSSGFITNTAGASGTACVVSGSSSTAGGGGTGASGGTGGTAVSYSVAGNGGGAVGGGGGGGANGNSTTNRLGGTGGTGQVIISCPSCYCSPTYSSGPGTSDQIANVTLGTLNNSSGASASPYYTFYNATTIPNIGQGTTASVSVTLGSDTNQYVGVWIDYNQDGTFQASEGAISGNAGANGTVILNIPIPAGAILGNTRMRIRGGNDNPLTTAQACGASSSLYGETEEYIVNIIVAVTCTTPAAQPTALNLSSVTTTTLSGSFTAASPAPSKYLIVRSTSATAPAPINGTSYSVGATTLGAGTYVVSNSTALTFSETALTSNTKYYYYVFSFNDTCTGAPYYLTVSPLVANTTTCLTSPTSSVATAPTNTGFTANWATVSGATGYLLDVSTVNTFASFVAGYNSLVVSGGSTVSQVVTGLSANTTYYYRVRATNATACTSVSSGTQTVYTGHCTPPVTTGTSAYITNFATSAGTININNTSGFTTGAYQDNYATMAVSKYATGTINYSFTLATTASKASVAIWVDWNNNFIFETSEKVFNTSGSVVSGTYFGTITVPTGTPLGDYRLRIKSDYSSTSPDACTTLVGNNTENEDYKFTVIAAPDYDLYTTAIAPNNTVNNTINVYLKDFDAVNNFYTDYTSPASIWMYAGVNTPTTTFDYIATTSQDVNNTATLVEFVRESTNPNVYKATIKFADYFCIPSGITVRGIDLYFRNKLGIGGNNQTANLFLDLGDATVQINAPVVAPATLITTTTATINWIAPTSGTIKGYEYYYSTSSTAPTISTTPSGSTLVNVVNAGLTLLTPSTIYYVWVRTKSCGSEKSAWSASGTFTTLTPPPVNDDPCNAISLTIGTTCTYATYTNAGATATAGVPAPGCSSYSGGDVWFKVIVPSTGAIKIDTQSGVMLDSGMAIYASSNNTCSGTITLIECDDDDGTDSMSMINITGLTPGATIFIRIFEYGNDINGTFGICVTEPPLVYCTPSSSVGSASNNYISNVSFLGTLNDISNTSTYSSTSAGYENFTGLATHSSQIQGEPINVSVQINVNSALKAWVDWNRNGVFTDSGETIFDSDLAGASLSSATFGFVVPNVLPGDYRIRIRTRNNSTFDSCSASNSSDTEDYIFTVISRCAAEILTVTDAERCGPGTVNLAATGTAGVQFKWYTASTGGSLLTTTASGSYTPNVTNTTSFYVTAFNGTCETQIRKEVVARVKELADITLPASLEACGDKNPIVLTATAGTEKVYLINENFENGLGSMSSVEGDVVSSVAKWRLKTGPFKPSEGAGTWLPVISSGFGSNSFATATSDMGIVYNSLDNSLQPTTASNTTGFINLTLKFRMYFSRFYVDNLVESGNDEFVNVEISTNGGTTWVATPIIKYITDIGNPGNMANISLNLNAYINQSNLKFRIRYKTQRWTHGVAVDDIQLFGDKTLVPSFTWSTSPGAGLNVYTDAGMTVPYTPGTPASTVYAIPDTNTLGNASFDINVSTTVTNGCTITKTINVTNKSKVWNGSASADWNNPNNWSPSGVPNNTACIIIPNTTVKPIVSGSASGKNISIKPLGELLVNSNNTLTINDAVDVKSTGKLTFENNASLVQVNESPIINSGNIIYKRNTSNMLRYSYTYWASPVYALTQTLSALSSATLHDKYYSWDSSGQSWTLHDNGTVAMEKAKGYIVRAPQTFPVTGTAASYNATFNGVPNNGLITIATQGSTTADKFNLIGNPYPSALDANLFLANSINPGLEGTIYLWTNFSGISSVPNAGGTYSYTNSDYATYNFSGGTATAPATGSSVQPTGYVAAGQSFFVKGISNGSGTATFNNTMRIGANNNQFFRNSEIERHRFWLNLENSQGGFNQALVAYVQGATNDYDRGYDGELFGGNTAKFYSIIPDRALTIQGKSLPFDLNDSVPMGYKTTVAGNYKITLDHFDGLFDAQVIYLKDKLLNTIHDIKNSPYNFTSAVGTFDNRFEIVYKQETLGINNPKFDSNSVVIYKKDKEIFINAGIASISQLKVFDIQGRMIYENKNINKTDAIIKNLPPAEQVLIVQVILLDGNIVSKKVVY